jgi:poly(A) polymerase
MLIDAASINVLDPIPARPGVYLVGGSVRDLLLGHSPKDLDIAVAGDPQRLARNIAARLAGRVVAMGKSDQTIYRVAAGDLIYDVALLRGGRIEDDLASRDFTINAVALELESGRLVDPLHGRQAIAKRAIRQVAAHAFQSDPLRLLRAYRLAATLGFAIEDETRQTIRKQAHLVSRPAGERLHSELWQLLASPLSAEQVHAMAVDGLLTSLLPEMQPLQGCLQGPPHAFDVFTHTLRAYTALEHRISAAARDPLLSDYCRSAGFKAGVVVKYAMLLHDIGKPEVRTVEMDGRVRFIGHAAHSARLAESVHRRLRLSRRDALQADSIIMHHLQPLHLLSAYSAGDLSRKAIHRFYRKCTPWIPEVLLHAMGDEEGKSGTPAPAGNSTQDLLQELLRNYFENYLPLSSAPPLLNGHDLMRHFGLPPSPALGRLLAALEEERIAGRLSSREAALAFVRRRLAENP